MKFVPLPVALFISLTVPAFADSVDVSGTGQGTAKNTPMPISEDLVVVHVTSDYTGFESDNPDNPMATLKGPCFGSILINAGTVSGSGNCHYTDDSGEMAAIHWIADGLSAEGRTQGSWKIAGGSGKWASASGGGRFDAGSSDQGVYTNNISGEVTMP